LHLAPERQVKIICNEIRSLLHSINDMMHRGKANRGQPADSQSQASGSANNNSNLGNRIYRLLKFFRSNNNSNAPGQSSGLEPTQASQSNPAPKKNTSQTMPLTSSSLPRNIVSNVVTPAAILSAASSKPANRTTIPNNSVSSNNGSGGGSGNAAPAPKKKTLSLSHPASTGASLNTSSSNPATSISFEGNPLSGPREIASPPRIVGLAERNRPLPFNQILRDYQKPSSGGSNSGASSNNAKKASNQSSAVNDRPYPARAPISSTALTITNTTTPNQSRGSNGGTKPNTSVVVVSSSNGPVQVPLSNSGGSNSANSSINLGIFKRAGKYHHPTSSIHNMSNPNVSPQRIQRNQPKAWK
jgi:hypothetical protein